MKREQLRQELELQSTGRESKMKQAFSKALELQQNSEENATALRAELSNTTRRNQQEIDVLTEQVGLRGHGTLENDSMMIIFFTLRQ